MTSHANVQCFKCNSMSRQQDQALQFSDSWSRSGCSATNVEFTVGSNNLQTAHLALSNSTSKQRASRRTDPFCFPPPLLERMPVSSPACECTSSCRQLKRPCKALPRRLTTSCLRSADAERASFGHGLERLEIHNIIYYTVTMYNYVHTYIYIILLLKNAYGAQ